MIEVWDINAAALDLFFAVETQWRVFWAGAFGGGRVIYQGLDYNAVDVVMRRAGYDDALFADLMVMEQAALAAFSGQPA